MLIIGLTGSIGSGKSLVSKYFRILGIPVHDADAEVHKLLKENSTLIEQIAAKWPDAVMDGQVLRPILGEKVFNDIEELKTLEGLIFPHLNKLHRTFLRTHAQLQTPFVVIDIPLLFEVNFDQHVDITVCVYADDQLRERRVLRRSSMTAEKFHKRDALQMSQEEKMERADFVLHSGLDKGHMFRQVKQLVQDLKALKGQAWGPHWKTNSKRE